MSKEELPLFNFNDDEQFARAVGHVKSKKGQGIFKLELTRVRNQRSLSQNAFYWSVVLPHAALGFREAWGEEDFDSLDAHEFLKTRYLQVPVRNRNTGQIMGYRTRGSTTKLDTKEFSAYLENVIKFVGEQFGIDVPPATRFIEQAPPTKALPPASEAA